MREIKFRAWSNKHSKMFRVREISMNRDGYTHGLVDSETKDEFQLTQEEFENNEYVWIGRVDFTKSEDGKTAGLNQNPDDEPFILMQYTGLKDKNGKEIYEGDIVNCFKVGPSVVVKKHYAFGLDTNGIGFSPFYEIYGRCEIIGNIYENPHLLEERT